MTTDDVATMDETQPGRSEDNPTTTGLAASEMDEAQSQIIEENPIGEGLDAFRASFRSTCESKGVSCSPDALDQFNKQGNDNPLCYDIAPSLTMQRAPESVS